MQELNEKFEMGVSGFSISPDSMTLCVSSLADTASLWDLNAMGKIASLPHPDSVNCSVFVSDTVLLTACEDHSVLLWDSRKLDEPTFVLKGFKEGVNHMTICNDHLFSACDDGNVYVHQMNEEMTFVEKLWVSSNTVNDLLVDADSGLLLACAEDCTVKALKLGDWNTISSEDRIVNTVDAFQYPVNHIAVHNGVMYAAMSEFVFDFPFDSATAQVGEEASMYEGHEDFIRGIQFVSDDTMLTTSDDASCIEWSVSKHGPVKRYKMHDSQIMASTVRRVDGNPDMFITGCEDGIVRCWKLPLSENEAAQSVAQNADE